MNLKLSKFNYVVYEGENCIIYNTLSGGILGLNKYFSEEYRNIIKGKNIDYIDKSFISNMKSAQMLIPEEVDEINQLKVLSEVCRFDNTSLTLTIAPTLECNFACPYCYEEGRRYNTMGVETINYLSDFIEKNMQGRKILSVAWYGGEPLLGIDIIESLSKKIYELKVNYHAHIVTNGYLLDEKMAERLVKVGVEQVQITIDGPEDIHNERRVLKNGGKSFRRILQNVSNTCELIPIKIRVNVDKDNISSVERLLDSLDEYNLKGKISLYLAPIHNLNNTCNAESCFTQSEFAEKQIEFYCKNIHRGYFFANIPKCMPGICGAVKTNAFVIDPLGDIYKCWDDIGKKEELVGNITATVNSNIFSAKSVKWLAYNPFEVDECKKCFMVPVCMGGCPNMQVKGYGKKCHPVKLYADEFVKLKKKVKIEVRT